MISVRLLIVIYQFQFCFSEMDAVAYIGVISRTAVLACGFFGNTLMILGKLFTIVLCNMNDVGFSVTILDRNRNNLKGILLRWDKLSISSMYLLNLSISGLLFSLTMPIWILQIISGQVRNAERYSKVISIIFDRFSSKTIIKYWSLGSFFCRSGSFIALLNLNSSTLFLVMMSIDRFLALTRPMQSYHFRTRKMVNYLSKMDQDLLRFC